MNKLRTEEKNMISSYEALLEIVSSIAPKRRRNVVTIAEELEEKGIKKGERRTVIALSGLIRRMRIKFDANEVIIYVDEFIATFNYDDLDKYERALDKAETLKDFKIII